MQTIQQINNKTKNKLIHIEYLTMKKEDILLSKHVQKMVQLINQNESLSNFEIKKIIKEFYSNLFYFKTTNYGIGAFSNFLNHHMFQLQAAMQENKKKNEKKRKIMFIQHEFKTLYLSFSTHDINKKIDFYNEIAKDIYNKKDKKEIIKFIKTKLNENKDLQEKFNKEVSNSIEYFKKLNTDEIYLKKIYKNVCITLKVDKENRIYPNPLFTPEKKLIDIKRNIKASKINARNKAIFNFHQENKISWLTLTLAHNNKDGTFSKEVKDLTTAKKLVKIFIKKLKYLYTKELKKTYNKEEIKIKLKEFKYFIASQLQTKPREDGTIPNVWHFHIMFNVDLLKIFGSTNVMICRRRFKNDSEFLENKEYYKKNFKKYKDQGWEKVSSEDLIIPNIFKLWADVVQEQLKNLKKLNPRSQNLQIFYKQNDKEIYNKKEIFKFIKTKIKENKILQEKFKKKVSNPVEYFLKLKNDEKFLKKIYINVCNVLNKQTTKYEIKKCKLKKTTVKKNISIIVAEYVTKYEAGLSDKEIKKMIKQKQQNKINCNLFQFSRSCKKLIIEKTIKYLPYDLELPQYQLTSFYLKNILKFDHKHPFFSLLRNSILKQNNKKVCYKDNNKEALDFEKNKKQYLIKFKQNKGRLSFFCGKVFYSLDMYDNYLTSPKYIQTLNILEKCFFIKSLQTKKPLTNFELEHNRKFTQFSNYINQNEVQLRN